MALVKTIIVTRDRLDEFTSEVLLLSAGKARRVVQSMIDLAVQGGTPGGGGGGMSSADKAMMPAYVVRTAANEAAPTSTNWPPRPSGFAGVQWKGAAPRPVDFDQLRDLHFLPPAETGSTATTSFTMADGSPWPAPWVLERVPAGGGATVTAGMGRLTTGTTGGYADTDTVAARYGDAAVDSDVLFTFRLVTADPWIRLVLRSDNANLDPSKGAVVLLSKAGVDVSDVDQWTYQTVGTAAKTHAAGTDYRARVKVTGATVQARTWPAAQAEPTTWDVTGAITATNGWQGFTVGSGGATGTAQTAAFDDIAFTAGSAGYGSAYGVAYGT